MRDAEATVPSVGHQVNVPRNLNVNLFMSSLLMLRYLLFTVLLQFLKQFLSLNKLLLSHRQNL